MHRRTTKVAILAEIAAAEDDYDEDPTLAQVSDSNLVSTAAGATQEDFQDLFTRVGGGASRRSEKADRSQPPSKKPSSSSQGAAVSGQQGATNGDGVVFDGRQRSASSVPPRPAKHHQKQVGRRLDTLTVTSAEDGRRRSFDERLSNSEQATQRRRSPAAAAGADYYANEYDRKHLTDVPVTTSADVHRSESRRHPKTILSISPTAAATTRIDYQQPPRRPQRSPIAHLPRSHQMIVDKTSPPPVQPPITSSTPSTNGIAPEGTAKMYSRDHRNAVSYGAAEQDFSVSEKNMYARGHRLAFSFTDTGAERTLPPPALIQHRDVGAAAANGSPDRRSTDECASFSSAFEYESLEKFCRECRAVFQAAANAATTTTSSSSSGHQHKRNGPVIHLPHQRQVKSLDINEGGRRAMVQHQRQVNSVDSTCVACMNDALNRLALLGGDDSMTMKLRNYAAAIGSAIGVQPATSTAAGSTGPGGAVLKRQLTLIESAASCDDEAESDLMQLDDAQSEQVKEECKQLWKLRSVFESDAEPDMTTIGEKTERMIVIDDEYDPLAQQSLDAEELETGATTSYTTSFESNTEPITVEDYLRSRPSGPYLEPPRLTVEAKRQKLRSLYARRQMQLQQQGASIESYESVDTVDSSSSGRPELILTSMESNQDQIGAQRDVVTRATITEQQQTSLSFDSSVGGDADSQAAAPVIVARSTIRGNDYLTPSPSTYRRRIETQKHTPSRERRAVEAFFDVVAASGNGDTGNGGTETDCSRSDILSGESFDDSAAAAAVVMMHQPMTVPPPRPPPYPNIHLVRMRRQYESGMNGAGSSMGHRFPPPAPPPPQIRDYCVDSRTEAIYREFMRYDPRLEASTARGAHGRRHHPRRFQYHYNGGGTSYENDSAASSGGRGKLTQENSIDEDPQHFGTTTIVPTPAPGRYDIPVIRLPEDDVAPPPTQHRPAHQIGTAMAAKG